MQGGVEFPRRIDDGETASGQAQRRIVGVQQQFGDKRIGVAGVRCEPAVERNDRFAALDRIPHGVDRVRPAREGDCERVLDRLELGSLRLERRVDEDEAPSTMADLLDPDLKGRVYTTPFGGGFDLLASDDSWGRERTLEFTRRFAKQVGGLGFNVQPLLTGEFDVMALLVPPGSVLAAEEDGAPIRFVVPTDAALLYQNLVSIPTNSAHPNAARLFWAYMLSKQACDTVAAPPLYVKCTLLNYTDNRVPKLPDGSTPSWFSSVQFTKDYPMPIDIWNDSQDIRDQWDSLP